MLYSYHNILNMHVFSMKNVTYYDVSWLMEATFVKVVKTSGLPTIIEVVGNMTQYTIFIL